MAIGSLLPRNFLGGMLAGDQIQQQKQAAELQQAIGMASLLQRQKEAERQAQMDPLRMQLLQAQVGDAQEGMRRRQAVEQAISQLPPDQQALARIAPQQFAASLFRQEKPQVVAPGAAIFQGGQEIYKNPAAAKDTRTDVEKIVERLNLPPEQARSVLENYLQKKTTHAPAPSANTTIINKQETEEAKAVGKAAGQTFNELQKSGLEATTKINRYDRLSQLLQGVNTGKLTPTMTQITALADGLGLKIDPSLGPKQAVQALSNEIALTLRNPSGGAGMPGALSDRDREFLVSMVPGLGNTEEGNRLLIDTAKKLAQRDAQVAKMARDYRRKHGSFGPDFFEELRQFSEANPLFPQTTPAASPAAPASPDIEALLRKYGG